MEKTVHGSHRNDWIVLNMTMQTLEDVIRIGTKSKFAELRLQQQAANNDRWSGSEVPCGDPYTEARRIAFRQAIERTMDSLELDALIYPGVIHPPELISFRKNTGAIIIR